MAFCFKAELAVPASMSGSYSREGYIISCSPALARTGKDFYGSLEKVARGISGGELPRVARVSTAAEELALQRGYESDGIDPRSEKAAMFNDLFGRNSHGWHAIQWTATALRVPKGVNTGQREIGGNGEPKYRREVVAVDISPYLEQIADPKFERDNWRDIIGLASRVEGEMDVPTGNGMVVVEYDSMFGIPSETREIELPHTGYNSHFWFNPQPNIDRISGQYDVPVQLYSVPHSGGGDRCLQVDAEFGFCYANPRNGLRLVRGSMPDVSRELRSGRRGIVAALRDIF